MHSDTKIYQDILECLIGYTPLGCAYGLGGFVASPGVKSGISAALGCIKDATWSKLK
jgi:hypothetical protein